LKSEESEESMLTERSILLLTHEFPPYPGAVGRYCWSLAGAAARAGQRVTVLAPSHSDGHTEHYEKLEGVNVLRFPAELFQLRELRRFERVAREVIDRGSWDVVHAADWPMIVALRNLALTRTQTIATLHGNDLLNIRRSLRAWMVGAPRALAQFSHYVCNSRHTASLLLRDFPRLADGDLRIAPPGVDEWWFETPSAQEVEAYRRRIGHVQGERIVLTVAPLEERKGQLATLAALARLPEDERRQIKYVCIGLSVDPAFEARIAAMAEAVGINTVLTGALRDSHVRSAYMIADVLALCGASLPRRMPGFGPVPLEAAAQGLPSVVTRVTSLPEFVRHDRTGWICEEGDFDGIANAIRAALSGESRQILQAACIAHAREFTWDRCAETTYAARLAAAA
jgi:glycosyltransferase involved in cell wall biosynthesis